jgi:hypothetical protein
MKIYMGIPTRDGKLDHRHVRIITSLAGQYPGLAMETQSMSLLNLNFNTLYANALNARKHGFTHFLMLHDDIIPKQDDWVRILHSEMAAGNLDVISAAVIIKGTDRLSCAMYDGEKSWPMTAKLFGPDTTIVNTGKPILMMNTGCLLMDITKPWADSFCFSGHDTIVKGEDGQFMAMAESEDYRMSIWLHQNGVPYGATSKVHTWHRGGYDYDTQGAMA